MTLLTTTQPTTGINENITINDSNTNDGLDNAPDALVTRVNLADAMTMTQLNIELVKALDKNQLH